MVGIFSTDMDILYRLDPKVLRVGVGVRNDDGVVCVIALFPVYVTRQRRLLRLPVVCLRAAAAARAATSRGPVETSSPRQQTFTQRGSMY